MKINKAKLKEDLINLARDSVKNIGYIGLAAAVLIGADRACHEIGKHTHFPTPETAQITDATFDRQATVTFVGLDYTINKAIFVYDIDGKLDSTGQRTAEEAFEIPYRYSAYEGTYKALMHVPVREWKHYVASDVDKPLVTNNITPMTSEQRALYSKILNMYQEKTNQK